MESSNVNKMNSSNMWCQIVFVHPGAHVPVVVQWCIASSFKKIRREASTSSSRCPLKSGHAAGENEGVGRCPPPPPLTHHPGESSGIWLMTMILEV